MTSDKTPRALTGLPDSAASFTIEGASGAIELAFRAAPREDARQGTAIICHPHPLQGGTMHNKVVTTLERTFGELGLATVRFNFRGVGESQGEHADGIGESDDLVRVAAWVRAERPNDVLWLAGFSFGSYVVLRAAQRLGPAQIVLVAPPVGRWDFSAIETPTCPCLIVQGEDDEVVDANAVFAWAASLDPQPSVIRMPETSHFFHRRLLDLRGAVRNAVRGALPGLVES